MAVYFDSAILPTKLTSNLDPNVELWTWLSYKMRDWASKVGPDYVEMISDHTTWDKNGEYNLTPTSNVSVQANLYSDANRAGTSNETVGVDYRTTNDDWSLNMYWTPTEMNVSYGYMNTQKISQINYANNTIKDTILSQGRPSYVIYSDTPGMRYFFVKLDGKNTYPYSTCISEVKSADKYGGSQPGLSANWIIQSNSRSAESWAFTPFYDGNTTLAVPYSYNGGFMGNTLSNSAIAGGFMLNRLLYNRAGVKWGLNNDAIVWSGGSAQDFQTAVIDGHDFINVGYYLWLRTDV